ncbi:MAG: hypothetical protein SOZ40_02900 [Ezakiella sp.]|nr:hypothetical protein [Ezakiella sp.]
MAPLSHEAYNFIEVVTSVEEDVTSTVKFVDNVLKDLNIEHFKSHIFYDADDKIWASRLEFLTTPNTVLLDENGRLVNIAGALDAKGLYDFYEKTFGEKIDGSEPPIDPDENNGRIELSFAKPEVKKGERQQIIASLSTNSSASLNGNTIRLTLTYPNGKTESFNRASSYNGTVALNFTASEADPDGEYQVRAEIIGGNIKANPVTGLFTVISDNPGPNPDDPTSSFNLTAVVDKKNYNPGDTIIMTAILTDSYNRAMVGENVHMTFIYPAGNTYEYDKRTDSYGRVKLTFTTNYNVPKGNYTFRAIYGGKTVEKVFSIGENSPDPDPNPRPDPNDGNSLSYQDRYNRGEFNHLSDGDLLPKLRNAYGKNILNYTVTNMRGQNVTVRSIVDGKRPTVVAMGYPTCGGCQASWKSLVNIDKSKFNMFEAMTSGDTNSINNVLNRLGLSQMSSYFYYNARDIFNLIGANYVPCLLYLDKDGNITNVSYFNNNNEVISIVNTITGTTSK